MHGTTTAVAFAAAGLAALPAPPATARAADAVRFVPCNAVSGPNGLIAAINAANNNTGPRTIVLAPRCAYFLTAATIGGNGLPVITGDVTLRAKDATIRRFSGTAFRLVQIGNGGTLTAAGITFAGGASGAQPGGGFLVNAGGTLRLSDGRVTQNTADGTGGDGGGIFSQGTASLFNTVVNNNRANDVSGGIVNLGRLTVQGGIIGFNTGRTGGGLFTGLAGGATAFLTSTDVVHNTATTGVGGGIRIDPPGSVTLRNSRVQFNAAPGNSGGGIDNNGTLQIVATRLSDNTAGTAAGNVGGALRNGTGGTTTIRNSTLTRNAANNGGAIAEVGGSVTAVQSLITNNHPNNCVGTGPNPVPGCSG